MRSVLVGGLLAAALVAGCGATTPSTAPTSAEAPASSTGPDPTAVPGAVTAPPVGAGPLELTALNVDFEPRELAAPAGTVVINYHNQDNGIPHNLEIKDASGTSVYQGEIRPGPVDSQESVGDLPAGRYTFNCTVHPSMQGTLTVIP